MTAGDGDVAPPVAERWNSNLHAFEVLLREVPPDARRGLDVGCGEGETARRLRRRVPSVVGLDPDPSCIEAARAVGDDIEYRLGSLEDADLEAAVFDVVTAVAVLHHLDHDDGLARLGALVRPGGRLLVVGLARSRSPRDLARDAFDVVALRRHTWSREVWETPAPKCWPPPVTHTDVRRRSPAVLPGARVRRLPSFRYGLTWRRAPEA